MNHSTPETWVMASYNGCNYPDYEVSNLGRVKRVTYAPGTWIGRIIKPNILKTGYSIIRLNKKHCSLHRLVFHSFHPDTNLELEINHIDGDKSNATLANLEAITGSENVLHAFRTGLKDGKKGVPVPKLQGINHPRVRLTEAQVYEIRRLVDSRAMTNLSIAKRYGISDGMVGFIGRRVSWKHLPERP